MNPSPIAQEYLEHGHSAACPIIDMHGHVGPFYGCYLPSSPIDRMRHRLEHARRASGSSARITRPWPATSSAATRPMREIVTAHPDQFLAYWVINPNSPEITARDLRGFHT